MRYLLLFCIFTQISGANPSYPLLGKEHFIDYWTPGIESAFQSLRLEDYINSREKFRAQRNEVKSTEPKLPMQPVVDYYLTHIYLRLNQIERANTHLQALKDSPGFSSAYQQAYACYKVSIAWQMLRRREWDKAYRLFEEALFLEPSQELKDSISQLYLQRTQFMRQGRDLVWKEQLLQTSQRLNKYHEETLIQLSRLYLDRVDFSKAVESLESLCQRFPSESRLYQLAEVYRYTNQLEKSYKVFHELHLQNPGKKEYLSPVLELQAQGIRLPLSSNDSATKMNLSNEEKSLNLQAAPNGSKQIEEKFHSLLREGKFQEALQTLQDWKVQFGVSPAWLEENLRYFKASKEYQKALDFIIENENQFPSKFDFYENRAKILALKDPNEARAYIEHLLRDGSVAQRDSEFRLLLAKIQLQTGMLEEAKFTLNELVDKAGEVGSEATFYLGVLATQEQDFPSAFDYYMKANELNPNQPKTILAIATAMQQLGHEKESMFFFRELFSRFSDSKFTQYAKSLIPRDFVVKRDKIQGFILWQAFETWGLNPNEEVIAKIEDIDSWIEALESVRHWDLLILAIELHLNKSPYREDLREKLNQLYLSYADLDFSFYISEEDLLQKLNVLKQVGEQGARELLDFLDFLHPAVEISPRAQFEVAIFLKEQGFIEAAMSLFERLTTIEGYEANSYAQLGFCHFAKKNLEASLNAYYQAINLRPGDTTLLFKLAELLKRKGELQRARLVYLEIIQLNDNHQSVEDAKFFLSHLEEEISKVEPIPSSNVLPAQEL